MIVKVSNFLDNFPLELVHAGEAEYSTFDIQGITILGADHFHEDNNIIDKVKSLVNRNCFLSYPSIFRRLFQQSIENYAGLCDLVVIVSITDTIKLTSLLHNNFSVKNSKKAFERKRLLADKDKPTMWTPSQILELKVNEAAIIPAQEFFSLETSGTPVVKVYFLKQK